uniref:Innexin n=1 Tax=Plectus sambesii TaxID=2011161 RepID=A0A914UY99_9BILA
MFFLDTFLKGLKPQFDDDIVDRLNYYYTPMLLVIFSLTLSAKQYVGQPIQCWVPAQFTGIPAKLSTLFLIESLISGYYQWVPFVLALQAILFYLPCLIWRLLNWQSGTLPQRAPFSLINATL